MNVDHDAKSDGIRGDNGRILEMRATVADQCEYILGGMWPGTDQAGVLSGNPVPKTGCVRKSQFSMRTAMIDCIDYPMSVSGSTGLLISNPG
jgi:hypothetical protein